MTLNKYDALWPLNEKGSVVAADMETAAKVLALKKGSDPNLIQIVEQGIEVDMPPMYVTFTTEVLPPQAAASGCAAYPTAHTLHEGDKQIFTAVVAPGWIFSKWQIEGIDAGTNEEEILTIPAANAPIKIQALFTT